MARRQLRTTRRTLPQACTWRSKAKNDGRPRDALERLIIFSISTIINRLHAFCGSALASLKGCSKCTPPKVQYWGKSLSPFPFTSPNLNSLFALLYGPLITNDLRLPQKYPFPNSLPRATAQTTVSLLSPDFTIMATRRRGLYAKTVPGVEKATPDDNF